MGRIISYSDIKNGRVPDLNDFQKAKELVSEVIGGFDKSDLFGAKAFGSVGYETPNVRSDFDLLIILQDEKP